MCDPPPSSLDPETAEYLNRQFVGISGALTPLGQLVAPTSGRLPEASIPGAIIYIEDGADPSKNGFYGCVKNSQGEGEWKKLS